VDRARREDQGRDDHLWLPMEVVTALLIVLLLVGRSITQPT
jgi:hypothetical protein